MFKKSESKKIKLELANHIDERNKKITKKILKGKAKLKARIERNGDFGFGPQHLIFSILNKTGHKFSAR